MMIHQKRTGTEVPLDLFLLADPEVRHIERYRETALCFTAEADPRIVGVIALLPCGDNIIEIMCLAVEEEWQNQGIGTDLLEKAVAYSEEEHYGKVLIRTANSSLRPLGLYQKAGFRIDRIVKDFFLKEYETPLYENGIRCVDQIVLELVLYSEREKQEAIASFGERFARKFPAYRNRTYSVWNFGSGYCLANELAGLVRTGRKRATSSASELYGEGEAEPSAGDLSLITFGNGLPACIVRTRAVREKSFRDIDKEEAAMEGEGDLSLEYWRASHRKFFEREYEREGKRFHEDIPVLYEVFELLYDENI